MRVRIETWDTKAQWIKHDGEKCGNYIFDSPNDPGYLSTCRFGIV